MWFGRAENPHSVNMYLSLIANDCTYCNMFPDKNLYYQNVLPTKFYNDFPSR